MSISHPIFYTFTLKMIWFTSLTPKSSPDSISLQHLPLLIPTPTAKGGGTGGNTACRSGECGVKLQEDPTFCRKRRKKDRRADSGCGFLESGRGSCQRRAGESLIEPTFACWIVGNVNPVMAGGVCWVRRIEAVNQGGGGGVLFSRCHLSCGCVLTPPEWAGSTCPSAPEWHVWWICRRGAPSRRAAPHLHQSRSGYSSWMVMSSPAWQGLRNPQQEPPDRKWSHHYTLFQIKSFTAHFTHFKTKLSYSSLKSKTLLKLILCSSLINFKIKGPLNTRNVPHTTNFKPKATLE